MVMEALDGYFLDFSQISVIAPVLKESETQYRIQVQLGCITKNFIRTTREVAEKDRAELISKWVGIRDAVKPTKKAK